MNLSPRQLRTFVLLADSLSFHKTAQALHVTQPTLSKQVKEFEDTIGVRLFERNTRNVSLTRDGQDLLGVARRVLDSYEAGLSEFGQKVRDRSSRFAIAALPTLAATLLPELVRKLTAKEPESRVEVYDLVADEALELLHARRVDIAVTAKMKQRDGFSYTEIFTEPFVLMHSGAQQFDLQTWDCNRLGALPVISMPSGTSTRELVRASFEKMGQEFLPILALRDLNVIARFTQAGCGVAILPLSAAEPFLNDQLAITPLRGAPRRSIGIYTRRDVKHTPLSKWMVQELRIAGASKRL